VAWRTEWRHQASLLVRGARHFSRSSALSRSKQNATVTAEAYSTTEPNHQSCCQRATADVPVVDSNRSDRGSELSAAAAARLCRTFSSATPWRRQATTSKFSVSSPLPIIVVLLVHGRKHTRRPAQHSKLGYKIKLNTYTHNRRHNSIFRDRKGVE